MLPKKPVKAGFFVALIRKFLSVATDTVMMPAMTTILRLIDICLFRAGPEDLPARSGLLQWSLFAYLLVGIGINLLDTNLTLSLSVSLADLIILVAFVWLILRGYQHLPRLHQSLLAFTGCGVLLGLAVMPFLAMFYQYDETEPMANVLLLVMMMMMLWSLMVTAHIFRRALDCSAPVSVAWTVLYVIVSIIGSGLVMSGVA